jgi:hypothetical protein
MSEDCLNDLDLNVLQQPPQVVPDILQNILKRKGDIEFFTPSFELLREALLVGFSFYVKFGPKSKYIGKYRSAGKTYFTLETLESFVDCSKHAYAKPQNRKHCLGYQLNTRVVIKYSENEAQLSSYCRLGYVSNKKVTTLFS